MTWSGDLSEKTAFISPKLSAVWATEAFSRDNSAFYPSAPVRSSPVPRPKAPVGALPSHGGRSWRAPQNTALGEDLPSPRTGWQTPEAHCVSLLPFCPVPAGRPGSGEPCLTNVAIRMQTGRSESSLVPGNHSKQGRVQTR